MNTILWFGAFVVALFAGMLAMLDFGRRFGNRRLDEDPEGARTGTSAVEGAIFALFGLLIAFTFSGAASRFDTRRHLIIQEANAVGTAWLRLDLLSDTDRADMQALFREYLDARLEVYRLLPDLKAAFAELDRCGKLQGMIWSRAVASTQNAGGERTRSLLLPALNDMFDITTVRTMAGQTHPPMVIFSLLFVLGLVCAFLAGNGMAGTRRRNWAYMIGFALVTTLTVYVILDLEYPRLGLIRVDAGDKVLIQLREGMK